MEVKAWMEKAIIPTYGIGKPEKNPVFLEKRVYQGSSGNVYPYPVIEKIMDEKKDKEWNAVYLENKYLKIMILPELGGRVQMAYDKTKKRHFVYYNQVIKPALVGLTGPWISGGIEFNWPQHHRPGTYEPVDFTIEENPDGSKTVWCSEIERMNHTKGMMGFTLYRDKAYLQVKVKLYNRTPHPQTFLWWANPAVHVNDQYQSVFPPDVYAVFDHGKRDVSRFPVATGTYYKVDYSAGVDISKYKNIPVPTSYMAINSKYNFLGGYENDTKGGLIHIADHHVSPGKKQWTWGNGDFGKAWDRNLTDEDGPYIELMCGVFTDNQPDFSWIMPYEERSFDQYFMPYRDLGQVKNATKEAMVNLEITEGKAVIKIYCNGEYKEAKILLCNNKSILVSDKFDFTPENSYEKVISVDMNLKHEDFCVTVLTSANRILVSWQPEKEQLLPVPEPAKPASLPAEISSIEQLYLTGLHLEQYRHATYNPADYYLEALKREPGDIRNNNAMGLLLMRKGQFTMAEKHFRRAIETMTERNPNPYDGEPFFNLGLALRFQYKHDEAFDAFYKSVWNAAWQDAGYFNLAQLACMNGNMEEAIDLVSRSLIRNWHNHKARHLKIALLRKLGRVSEAGLLISETLNLDKFNFGVWYEKYLLEKDEEKEKTLEYLKTLLRNNIHNYIEYAIDYAMAGLFDEADSFLGIGIDERTKTYPMAYYLLGWFAYLANNKKKALSYFIKAEQVDPDYCFPNRLEEMLALQCACNLNSKGAMAFYYLGNFWYAARQYDEASDCWEKSVTLSGNFPTVHRNLALAFYNKQHQPEKAVKHLEKAFLLDTSDARILMELDQLYKKLNYPFEKRLMLLEKYPDALEFRDDLYLEVITIYNSMENHEKALDLLMKRRFHPWEGGEGKVVGQYMIAHIGLAKKAIKECSYELALDHLDALDQYPYNLGEGKLYGAQENDINYWKGCAYSGLGDDMKAKIYWMKASEGLSEPSAAVFYNDQQPDKIFYQGMALRKLGRECEANGKFYKLRDFGEKHIFDHATTDYFAVSLPDLLIWDDDLQKRNTLHCLYLMGLGYLGLGEKDKAMEYFTKVIATDINHTGCRIHMAMCLNK